MKRIDVVVIGAGAAGLRAAAEAASAGLTVVVLNKGQVGRSGATVTVTGDISVDGRTMSRLLGLAGSEEDSEQAFFEDTIKGGAFLNHQSQVQTLVTEVGPEVKRLLDSGLKVSGIAHAPGHRFPRGVLVSGMQILQLLCNAAIAAGAKFRDEFYVTDIIRTDDGVAGVAGIDLRTGRVVCLETKAAIIAAGGGMMVYPFRTAPEELIGDGYRMALDAGADLIDMEMVQFLPCCLVNPPLWRGIQFPWIIGPQSSTRAWLLNRYGERFMARYDAERMEMATRDIVSIASVKEVLEGRGGPGGGVFLSWAHLPRDVLDFLPQWYGKPLLRANWYWEGFDFRPLVERIRQGYAVEVAPASHFFMGGIRIGEACETQVPGLYACGEAAGGLHGANRLSGNACSQFLVQGRRAGQSAARFAAKSGFRSVPPAQWRAVKARIEAPLERSDGAASHEVAEQLRQIANRSLNVLRSGNLLDAALADIRGLRANDLPRVFSRNKERRYNRNWVEALETSSAALTLEAMVVCAQRRKESRGAHYREDFPLPDDQYLANGVLTMSGGEMTFRSEPVVCTRLQPGSVTRGESIHANYGHSRRA